MTVADLIAALSRLPRDMPVYVATSDRYYPDQPLNEGDVQVEEATARVVLAKATD